LVSVSLFGDLFLCWFVLSLVCSVRLFCGLDLVSWPCGDSAGCEESVHMPLCFLEDLFAHVPHSWDCGVVFVVAVV